VRLVAGFALVMLAVLTAAGGFVYWRVELALDRTLDEDLTAEAAQLAQALRHHPGDPANAVAALPTGATVVQVLESGASTAAPTATPIARPTPRPAPRGCWPPARRP
jgi:hypothetical protein